MNTHLQTFAGQVLHRQLNILSRLRAATAVVLLWAMLFTLAPAGLFHHHHHEEACEQNDPHHEADPCHISIHHAHESKLEHCGHTLHVEADTEECIICKFLSHQSSDVVLTEPRQLNPLRVFSTETGTCYSKSTPVKNICSPDNRGPPVKNSIS